MKHRCLSFLAALAVLLSCFAPVCADAAVADSTDIATWQELTAFAQNANNGNSYAGKTVRLTADITAPKDAQWSGVNGFAGTFDGQGHTLSGISVSSDSTSGTGFFNITASGAAIRDLTIKNSTFTGAQRTGAVVGNASGTLEMTNVRVTDDVTVTSAARAGGLIGNADGNATVTLYNCASQANLSVAAVGGSASGYAGGMIGWVHSGASATFTGCLYAGAMSRTGGNYFGGMVGHVYGTENKHGSVTVKSSVALPNLGGLSGQLGGFVGGSQAADYADISIINSYSGYDTVVGSSVSGRIVNDSPNYWTPSSAVNGDTLVIATAAQLYGFALASKSYNFSGRTLRLNKDLDLSGWGDWPMLGSASRPFAGTFNGGGCAVSGVSVSVDSADPTSGSYPAGFVAMLDGTLQNLTLRNSSVISNAVFVGGAVGRMRGSAQVRKIHVASDVLVRGYQQVGGVVGKYNGSADGGAVDTCWSEATVQLSISSGALAAGGVVGVAQHAYSVISHCLFTGTVEAGRGVAGGILGDVMDGGVNSFATVSDCCSAGTLNGSVTGGILGTFADRRSSDASVVKPTQSYSISNCCAVADKVIGSLTIPFSRFDDDWTTNAVAFADVSSMAAYASHLLSNTYWVFPKNGVPALKEFSAAPDYEEISNKASLLAFAKAVNAGDSYAGKTVRLTADIASVGTWSGINGFAGTFDGAGHTISGLTVNSAAETGTGFFNITASGAVICDLTIANSSITGTLRTGAVVGNASGTLKMTNVRVTDDVTVTSAARAGGLIGNADENATVTLYNCASQASLSVDSVGGNSAGGFAGGMIGWVHSGATVTITGCLYAGAMTRTGGNYFGGMVGHIYGTEDTHGSVTVQSSVALPNLDGLSGELGGFVGGSQAQAADYADISIINSYSGYNPVVGSSVSGRIAGESNYWTPSSAVNGDSLVIATAAQLYGFALASKSYNFSDLTLRLNKDLDLSDWGDWPVLGSASLPFAGTFNGSDHTLTGLYVSVSSGSHTDETLRAGFVADLSGTVQNLTISESRFVSDAYFSGAVAGRVLGGRVLNVRVSDTVYVQAYNQSGGVAGSMNNGATISNCLCQARVVQIGTGDLPGGIISTVRQTGNTIAHCLFSGSIRGASSNGYAGGLVGWVAGSAGVTISDCVSTGTYTGASNYGGAIGSASGSYTINSSYVSHTTKYVGSANPGNATGSAYYPSAWQLKGTGVCANLNSTYWTLAADKLPVLKSFSDVPSIEETPMMSRESIACVPAANAAAAVNYTVDGRFDLGIYSRRYYYGTTGAYNKYIAYLSTLKTAGFTLYEGGDALSTSKDNIYTAVLVKGSLCAVVTAWEISDNAQINITIRPITDGKIWNGEELFAGANTQGWSASAVDYGGNNYIKTFTGKMFAQYNTLCSGLVSGGYTLVASNDSGLYGKVYTRSYQKDDLTLTATYSTGKSEIRLSAAKDEPLSPHLNNQATWAADNTRYESTLLIRPAMGEDVDGENSFIIRLKNGHFLINDGGVPNEAAALLETLEHLTPKGQIPVVEGWFISHSHMDHIGVLYQLYKNPALCQRIRVDGVYFSDPSLMVYGLSAEPSVQREALYTLCADLLKTSDGSATPIYRNHTGERFYFSDISVDIILSQEQLPLNEYSGDLNDSSTWICLNIDGDKVLLAGDGDVGGKARIMTYYSKADMTFTMRSSLHHGSNETIEFIDHCPTTTILYACKPGHWEGTSSATANTYLGNKSQEQIYQDVVTIYTFPYTVGSYIQPEDISTYRTGEYTAPSAPSGKIFAGWYWDPAYDFPVSADTVSGCAIAKFADADVLTVQTQQDMTQYADGSRKLRIVTSVDSMDYQEVGFKLTYNNSAGVAKTVRAGSTLVYQSLNGYVNETTQETYLPTVFSPESIRFCAFKLVASGNLVDHNRGGITAQPYWITADGTTVYGTTRSGLKFFTSGLHDETGWEPDFTLDD